MINLTESAWRKLIGRYRKCRAEKRELLRAIRKQNALIAEYNKTFAGGKR